jgi:hypothetical protein
MGFLIDTAHPMRLFTLEAVRAFLHAMADESSFVVEGWEPTCERDLDLVVAAARHEGADEIDLADGTFDAAVVTDLLRLVIAGADWVCLRSDGLALWSWPDKAQVYGTLPGDGARIDFTTAHRGAALGRFLEARRSPHIDVRISGPNRAALDVVPRIWRTLRARAFASLVLGADTSVTLAKQLRPLDLVWRTDLADVRWPSGEVSTHLLPGPSYAEQEAAWSARVDTVMQHAGIAESPDPVTLRDGSAPA